MLPVRPAEAEDQAPPRPKEHPRDRPGLLGQAKVERESLRSRRRAAENDRSPASQAIANLFPAKPILESFRSDDQRRKKKRGGQEGRAWMQQVVVPPLPPPPEPAELDMLFTRTFDLADLPFAESLDLPPEVRRNVFRARSAAGAGSSGEEAVRNSDLGR